MATIFNSKVASSAVAQRQAVAPKVGAVFAERGSEGDVWQHWSPP